MMGQLSSGQDRLFYSFNLEDHIPANHLLRSIDRCLDLSNLRHYLADFYSPIGRPSIDPELMIRMLIVGYCYGIRSERRLCEEAHLNLAYRWFCRLSLEDEIPNHSTFSKNRHGRFRGSDLFRWCSTKCCVAAWTQAWLKAKDLPWTPASSKRMRVGSAAYRVMNRSTGAIRP
jgi:transposase